MPGTVHNHLLLEKYKEIINDRYVEPENDIIIGSFWALPAVKPSKRKVQAEKDKVASNQKRKKYQRKKGKTSAFFLIMMMMTVKSIYKSPEKNRVK